MSLPRGFRFGLGFVDDFLIVHKSWKRKREKWAFMNQCEKKLLPGLLLAIALGTFTTAVAYAHGGASGIVKERMDAMGVMGKAMKAVGEMFKGQTSYDADAIQAAAESVAQHAQDIPGLFPDSDASRHGKATEALPVIWEQKDRFDALSADMLRESRGLASIAHNEDKRAVRLQFAKTAKICSVCHTAFRKPKD